MKTMRQSRQSSAVSTTDKSKYPRCQRKKQHQKESLNLVCLSPHCKNRGLICIMCKSEHQGHVVQPIKTFLTKLEDSLKKMQLSRSPKIQQNPSTISNGPTQQGLLERLEEQHLQTLSLLKIQIQEISERVRTCEEEVMKEYNRIRQKVQTEFEKETLIGQILADIQKYFGQGERQDNVDLKFTVGKLLPLLKVDKTQISILNEAEKDLNSYVLSAKTFKNNMLVWQRETSNIITDIFKAKAQYQMREALVRPTTACDFSSKSAALAFSSQFKTDSVTLDKDGKNAKVKDDKNGKIVLLNTSVLEHKNNAIKFKITGIGAGSSIQVGLCMKPQVFQKQFKFQKANASHGLFVLSSNGFIYSSADAVINNSKGPLTFKANDEITVEVDAKQTKIVFSKKNFAKKAEINLKQLSEIDWKELYFCVGMNGIGDKVQLLE